MNTPDVISLRHLVRFGFLLILALIPVLLFAALDAFPSANLGEIAQRTANEFDRLIQLRERQVFTIAAFPSIRAFTASPPEARSARAAVALNELQAWVAADTGVRQAFITDEAGIVIMSTEEGWSSDLHARPFVRDALAGQLAVSPVALDRGEFSTYYSAPILNNSQNIAGALVVRVSAQELWDVTPRGENFYAVLADENGVRLDDSGDPARRLVAFAPLDAPRVSRIVNAQNYGALMLAVRSTNFARAQELITQGALDQLRAADLGADSLGYQRLLSEPWVVLILAPPPTFASMFARLAIPVAAAFVLAIGGMFLLSRV